MTIEEYHEQNKRLLKDEAEEIKQMEADCKTKNKFF